MADHKPPPPVSIATFCGAMVAWIALLTWVEVLLVPEMDAPWLRAVERLSGWLFYLSIVWLVLKWKRHPSPAPQFFLFLLLGLLVVVPVVYFYQIVIEGMGSPSAGT